MFTIKAYMYEQISFSRSEKELSMLVLYDSFPQAYICFLGSIL